MLAMTGVASGRPVIHPGNVFPTPRPAGKATLPAGRWDLIVPDAAVATETAMADQAANLNMNRAAGTPNAAAA